MLVHSTALADAAALSHRLLRATLHLERKVSDTLAARREPCLRRPDGQCLVVSPLMFWHHEEHALMADADILHTLAPTHNVSFAGVPIESQMVVAWRDKSEYPNMDAGSTVFLALTYFFPERDCLGKTGHAQWLQILEDASKDSADLITEGQQSKLIALEVCRAPRFVTRNLNCPYSIRHANLPRPTRLSSPCSYTWPTWRSPLLSSSPCGKGFQFITE